MKSIELLKDSVSMYSTSGNEKLVSEYYVKQMSGLGFKSSRDKAGNAIGEIGSGDKIILMLGHIDTVAGEIPVRVENNKLYGRGTVDAKGSFCSFILAAAKAELKCKVIVVGAVEEECPTSRGARFIIDKIKPDYIIIGEPSGTDAVTLGYKGSLMIDYSLTQELTHTSSEEFGVAQNAVEFYSTLKKRADDHDSEKESIFNKVQLKINYINSENDGFNEHVKMTLRYRIPIGFNIEEEIKFMDQVKGKASISTYGLEHPVKAEKNNPLVRAFLKSIREHGLTPKFKVKTGTSDMNILGKAFPDVPILAYGPGNSNLDHTPNENIDLEEYNNAIEILKNALESLS